MAGADQLVYTPYDDGAVINVAAKPPIAPDDPATTSDLWGVVATDRDGNYVIGGLENVAYSHDDGVTWTVVPGVSAGAGLVWSDAHQFFLALSRDPDPFSNSTSGLIKVSRDLGETWEECPRFPTVDPPITVNPPTGLTVVADVIYTTLATSSGSNVLYMTADPTIGDGGWVVIESSRVSPFNVPEDSFRRGLEAGIPRQIPSYLRAFGPWLTLVGGSDVGGDHQMRIALADGQATAWGSACVTLPDSGGPNPLVEFTYMGVVWNPDDDYWIGFGQGWKDAPTLSGIGVSCGFTYSADGETFQMVTLEGTPNAPSTTMQFMDGLWDGTYFWFTAADTEDTGGPMPRVVQAIARFEPGSVDPWDGTWTWYESAGAGFLALGGPSLPIQPPVYGPGLVEYEAIAPAAAPHLPAPEVVEYIGVAPRTLTRLPEPAVVEVSAIPPLVPGTNSFNPSSPCALGPEWMPFQDSVATLASDRKVYAPAVRSQASESIKAIWFSLCARFSPDNVVAVEVYDITGDELEPFDALIANRYAPGRDHYKTENTKAVGGASFGTVAQPSDRNVFGALVDPTNQAGTGPFGQPIYDRSYVMPDDGGQSEALFDATGIAGDFVGKWITTVRIVATVAVATQDAKPPAAAFEGIIRVRGERFSGGVVALDTNPIEGAEMSWSWFANPGSGLPWTPADLDAFDVANFIADSAFGVVMRPTGDSTNRPLLTRLRLEVIAAPTDQRKAMAGDEPRTKQGWIRLPMRRTSDAGFASWAKLDNRKYMFAFRKTTGSLPLALCRLDEPGQFMAGPPFWTSYEPDTDALSEVNPSLRPRRLGEESSVVCGIVFERDDGTFSVDSQPYATTSPTQGPDSWPYIGAFFDLAQVNERRSIFQDLWTPETNRYGWLQLRLAQVSNVSLAPLVVELRRTTDDQLMGTWTFTTDELAAPKRQWQRVGKRCDDVTPPEVETGVRYYLRLRSSAEEDVGWLAQVLNGGTGDGPPTGPPEGALVRTWGGVAVCINTDGEDRIAADLEFVLSTLPPAPLDLVAENAGEICGIDFNICSWLDPGFEPTCGLHFAGWEVERSIDGGLTWERIGLIDQQNITSLEDHEHVPNREMTYRVRLVREDGARSDWSNTATATATQRQVGLKMSSNVMPEYTVFANDINEARDYDAPERAEIMDPAGRNFHIVMRELEDRGRSFSTTLLVRAGSEACVGDPCFEYGTAGVSVFDPIRRIARAALPYVCVTNEAGDRWFAYIATPADHWRRGTHTGSPDDTDERGNYVMDITVIPVTDRPYAPSADIGYGSGSGSGA